LWDKRQRETRTIVEDGGVVFGTLADSLLSEMRGAFRLDPIVRCRTCYPPCDREHARKKAMQFLLPIEASAHFGFGVSEGAILIRLRRR